MMRRSRAVLTGGRGENAFGRVRTVVALGLCICLVATSIAGCASVRPTQRPALPAETAVVPAVHTAAPTNTPVPLKATREEHVDGRSSRVGGAQGPISRSRRIQRARWSCCTP